jgi:type II secretory pathway pseudopilin PulG
MNHKTALLTILALALPAGVVAQSSTPDAGMAASAQSAQTPEAKELQKQMEELRSQMSTMQQRLDQLQSSSSAPPASTPQAGTIQSTPTRPAGAISDHVGDATKSFDTFSEDNLAAPRYDNVPLDPKYDGFFYLPGTQTLLKIGGYFKTDSMFDFKQAGNADEFITSSIPVPQVPGIHNNEVSIRPTRLSLDFRIPNTKMGEVRTYVEADFFGTNSNTPRLRHAYAQAGNLLIGQTFTNFMDPDASPDTLDFEGPNGYVYVRSPQIRYSLALDHNTTVSFSAEKPVSDVAFKTPQFTAQPNAPAPDGTVRVRREFSRGHAQAAVVLRDISAFLPSGKQQSVFGWGVNASAFWKTFGQDNVMVEGTYGHGVSRYIQDTSGLGIDAEVADNANPHLKATPAVGAEVAYQHYWTKKLRSNLVYGYAAVQNTQFVQPAGVTFNPFSHSNYGATNVIWNAYSSLNVGAEFLYGGQVLKNGQFAYAPRLQFSVKYSFVRLHPDKN